MARRMNPRRQTQPPPTEQLRVIDATKRKPPRLLSKQTNRWHKQMAIGLLLGFCIAASYIIRDQQTAAMKPWKGSKFKLSSVDQMVLQATNYNLYDVPQACKDGVFRGETCASNHHVFAIRSGKVKWTPPKINFMPLKRGESMHCLLARAAQRLGSNFEAKTIRIGLGDRHPELPYIFGPAMIEDILLNETLGYRPLLFPDPTFESYPEGGDYSFRISAEEVIRAAHQYGLPGTTKWLNKRDGRLAWRGSSAGALRRVLLNQFGDSPLLDVAKSISQADVQSILGHTNKNLHLTRPRFCQYRFLLHMNGIHDEVSHKYSSALKWKLLCGSLVFAPSPRLIEWWNYGWKPYEHYVPFTTIPDLLEKVDYYAQHLKDAARIAQNGMELAQWAFTNLDSFVDQTLSQYAAITNHMEQPECDEGPTSTGGDFMSLKEIQEKYGPTICTS